MHIKFQPINLDHLEDLGIDGTKNIETYLKGKDGKIWTGLIWLRIGASGSLVNAVMNHA
jgi:hypothetical protein